MNFTEFEEVDVELNKVDNGWIAIGSEIREDGRLSKIFYKNLECIVRVLVNEQIVEIDRHVRNHSIIDENIKLKVSLNSIVDSTQNDLKTGK